MPRSGYQLRVRDPQILLLLPLLARAHRHAPILRTNPVDTPELSAYESRLTSRAAKVRACWTSQSQRSAHPWRVRSRIWIRWAGVVAAGTGAGASEVPGFIGVASVPDDCPQDGHGSASSGILDPQKRQSIPVTGSSPRLASILLWKTARRLTRASRPS